MAGNKDYYFNLINRILRCMPFSFARLIDECLKICLNDSSVNASHSLVVKFSTSGKGVNADSFVGLEKRFHGQTSWHISQPNAQSLNLFFISSGINISFSSIVK